MAGWLISGELVVRTITSLLNLKEFTTMDLFALMFLSKHSAVAWIKLHKVGSLFFKNPKIGFTKFFGYSVPIRKYRGIDW